MARLLLLLSLLFLLSNCIFTEDESPPELVQGPKPIYSKTLDKEISVSDVQQISRLGKVFYMDSLIFVNEQYKGVYILDNRNPSSPVLLKFIHIPNNLDLAVRSRYLYANQYRDLVTIDIQNLSNIHEVHRIENFFDTPTIGSFPTNYSGWFECVDPECGTVLGWKDTLLYRPSCFR